MNRRQIYTGILIGLLVVGCSSVETMLEEADRLGKNGQWEEVIEVSLKAVRRYPESSKAHLVLADAYNHLHNYAKALDEYAAVIEFNDEDLKKQALNSRGYIHRLTGDLDSALADFSELQQTNPVDPMYLTKRASIKYLLGKYVDARDDLDYAIELCNAPYGRKNYPNYSNPYYWRWLTLIQLGEEDLAGKDLEILRQNPGDLQKHLNVAAADFERVGNFTQAFALRRHIEQIFNAH